jgi:hypothetical protein
MAISVEAPPPTVDAPEPPRRRTRRAVAILLALALVAAAVTGIVILARAPNLTEGSFSKDSPTVVQANDGYGDTRQVIDGNVGGTLLTSVLNNGSVPVTLLGLNAVPAGRSVLAKISFEPAPFAPGKVIGGYTGLVDRVTLRPGQEAGVVLRVSTPACLPEGKGDAIGYDAIPVKVRRLGLTRITGIPLSQPLWIYYSADHPATGCG